MKNADVTCVSWVQLEGLKECKAFTLQGETHRHQDKPDRIYTEAYMKVQMSSLSKNRPKHRYICWHHQRVMCNIPYFQPLYCPLQVAFLCLIVPFPLFLVPCFLSLVSYSLFLVYCSLSHDCPIVLCPIVLCPIVLQVPQGIK